MIDTRNLVWQDLTLTQKAPATVQFWLDDNASLTAKLKQQFSDFSVHVLSQKKVIPYAHEIEVLNTHQAYAIREVELLGNDRVMVFARSVIPITNDTQEILNIGSKPLGEFLFNDPSIKRGPMQITQIDNVWGRRSTFTIGETKLLVSEFFMEELYA
jgi:chorismate--pyruvate lyase